MQGVLLTGYERQQRQDELRTYKMANLRGLSRKTGVNIRPMQVANIAKAASSGRQIRAAGPTDSLQVVVSAMNMSQEGRERAV